MIRRWQSFEPYFLSILRIVAGLLFFMLGLAKLFAIPAAIVPGGGVLPPMSLGGVASILELVGGALLVLGLFTRCTAFIVSGEMAFAYFIGHAGNGFWPVLNGGGDAILYCFLWLYLSAAGGGPWSLDALLRRNRRSSND